MAFSLATRSWQVPSADADDRYKLGWIDETCQDGGAWNQSQPGYDDWLKSLDILNGRVPKQDAEKYRDYFCGRRLRTNVRTAVAGLSNIRPMWGFHSIPAYQKFAMMMNKTSRALYLEGNWGADIEDALWYAAATNTGWIRPVFSRDMAGMGRGRVKLYTYGQPCVLPFQMPSSGDYNQAYAVNLMDEIPIFEAHGRFPLYQEQLKPTKSQLWYSSEIRGAAEQNSQKRGGWFNPFTSIKSENGQKRPGSDLYIPIRYTTVIDLSVNTTGRIIPMGQFGTSWYYEVPSVGMEWKNGPATEDQARMYPRRRLIISSEKCIMYDGPAFNWDGDLDLVPLCVDRTPWAPGGFSMVHDGYAIEKQINDVESGILARIKAQNNLPLGYDLNTVTVGEAEKFDPMDTDNVRFGYDGTEVEGTPFKLGVPFEVYKIFPEQLEFLKGLKDELDYTMQIRDLVELSKAKVLGKDMDAAEKMLSSLGPIVRNIGKGMERSLTCVGKKVGWRILQYMTAAEIMQFTGPESVDMQIFDYNPNDLYPSHLPDEQVHDADTQKAGESKYTPLERARFMTEKIRFFIMPGSLHDVHQMSTLLIAMQMKARGMHISDYFCMSAANIPDVVPPDGNSEQQRWESEQEDNIAFQARMAIITQTIAGEQHLGGPPGGPSPTAKGGRPPSGNAPPKLEHKSNGRPLISESK